MTARPRSIPALPPAQLRPLRNRLKLSVQDAGLTDLSPPANGSTDDRFWELEPTPLIIPPEEWSTLQAALRQRAVLINTFLADIYHRQEAMNSGVVPPEVTLADPYFRRPSFGLTPDRHDLATLIRFDLVKTAAGWHFTETHTNAPVGLSYAVQNRRFLTQEASDYYRALPDYKSVINFPLQLVQALHALAPAGMRQPSMVFLSAGPRYPFYSEHSFLARKMGLRLAHGEDLLVLDNCVYFKTIAGLERVDVIYRRLNDAHIDPVVFSTDRESAGIPGLMQCIRAGNVVVANAIGAGVAENRALNAYLPQLSRFYYGEPLLLPSIPTYVCTDNDQLDSILDRAGELDLRPAHSARIDQPHEESIAISRGKLPREVLENPHAYVAQARLKSLSFRASGARHTPFRLSAFALTQGDNVSVLPGGIVNFGPPPYPVDRVGQCADVIVLAGDVHTAGALADFETNVAAGAESTVPSSRAAEALFWLGRYLERAESTARMLSILDDVVLEEIPASDRRRWLPLWRGLLEATGHADQKITARTDPRNTLTSDLIWRMALGASHASSLLSATRSAAANARELREFVSPEAGRILTQLEDTLLQLARQSPAGRSRQSRLARSRAAASAIRAVLGEINACVGTASRTMLQDAGWHFLQIGQQIERATVTARALSHMLPAAVDYANNNEDADDLLHYRDNPELSALLRMLGSQDAYRRIFRTRSQPLFVARLFLQQTRAPRCILYNLQQIATSLAAIAETSGDAAADPALQLIDATTQELKSIKLGQHFDPDIPDLPGAPSLESVIMRSIDCLAALHDSLGDQFFSHQARLDPNSNQPELGL
ncbi:circularly permuted type 2 ATP-grasp protein [Synoicihabitans lomoniglobus]|uniref:Circularly permuted type 2 ATP-grasp protein n=1 Tax=Synoicihabitans lomoniglobus TaxID=2909285 RepID=A0AAF0CPP1_9BACT|nr:circularly permuted type 2 ATP-grasp protein [Opitutaceae bacterium LMO-M01]WED65762.1 circularly permuted type 2 ATP-grasp protein [Opitutaceae bacterium LMO-M01]